MQVFWGKDAFGAREAIEEVASEQGVGLIWVDKEALAGKPLRVWVEEGAGGLFGRSLVVGVNPAGWLKADQEVLGELVGENPTLLLIWQRGDFDKRAGWFAKAKKAGLVREFAELSAGQLSAWAQGYVKKAGGRLEPAAAGELVARLGVDRWVLKQELDKLLLRFDVIDADVVKREVVVVQVAGEVFALLDALAMGNKRGAVERLEALLNGGESEFYVLSMLAYQVRTLLVIRSGQEAGKRESEVAKENGLHPYVVQKNWRAAQRWSGEQLVALLTRLLATDAAMKRGVVEPKVGVTMLVAGMVGAR